MASSSGDQGDYEEVSDRINDKVPEDLTDQSQIRDWIESELDMDQGGQVRKIDKLHDEVARRIEQRRAEGDFGGDGGGGGGTPSDVDAAFEAAAGARHFDPGEGWSGPGGSGDMNIDVE